MRIDDDDYALPPRRVWRLTRAFPFLLFLLYLLFVVSPKGYHASIARRVLLEWVGTPWR